MSPNAVGDLEIDAQWKEERRLRKIAAKAEFEAAKAEGESRAVVVGEVIDDSDDTEFESDDSEADISNALTLLQDCVNMLTVLSDERIVVVSKYLQQEARELLAEVSVFLDEYDMDELNDKEAKLFNYLP